MMNDIDPMEAIGNAGSAVQIRGLRKRFGPHAVLNGIDLDVGRSECVCIIGPSGSGKSTLFEVHDFFGSVRRGRNMRG